MGGRDSASQSCKINQNMVSHICPSGAARQKKGQIWLLKENGGTFYFTYKLCSNQRKGKYAK